MPLTPEEEVTILRMKVDGITKSMNSWKIISVVLGLLFLLETMFLCLTLYALGNASI